MKAVQRTPTALLRIATLITKILLSVQMVLTFALGTFHNAKDNPASIHFSTPI